jgi:iron(III) transport system permease protein
MLDQVRVQAREFRRIAADPLLFTLLVIVAGLLVVFILFPVVRVLTLPRLEHWREFVGRPALLRAAIHSLVMMALSTTTATLVGFLFAYGLVRTQMPLKAFFRTLTLLPLISPPFVTGLAFILLFGRRGLFTYSLLGLDLNPYGWHGLWMAQTLAFFPVAYLTIAGVLRSLDPALELAAQDLGASGFRLFRTVTLPLLTPGIASAGLLVGIFVLADFGNPMLIGGNYSVLATEAYMQVIGRYNTEMAALLASVLLLPSLVLFLVQRYIMEKRSFVTVTGRPSALARKPAPWYVTWPLFGFCLAVSLVILAIYLVIVLGAFSKVWGVDWSLSLRNFQYTIFRQRDLYNSVRFALSASVLTAVLATLGAYLIERKRFLGREVLDFFTVLPAAIPGTLMGIGYVLAFNQPPLELTGTAAIIVLSMAFRTLPVGYRNAVSALHQIDVAIERASEDLGADSLRTFVHIVLPLLKYAFFATLIYTFVKSINTLSAVIFLISPGNVVASASILGLAEHGYWGQAAALATALISLGLLSVLAFRLIAGRRARLFEL